MSLQKFKTESATNFDDAEERQLGEIIQKGELGLRPAANINRLQAICRELKRVHERELDALLEDSKLAIESNSSQELKNIIEDTTLRIERILIRTVGVMEQDEDEESVFDDIVEEQFQAAVTLFEIRISLMLECGKITGNRSNVVSKLFDEREIYCVRADRDVKDRIDELSQKLSNRFILILDQFINAEGSGFN